MKKPPLVQRTPKAARAIQTHTKNQNRVLIVPYRARMDKEDSMANIKRIDGKTGTVIVNE